MDTKKSKHDILNKLVSGAAAGAGATAVVYPIDTVSDVQKIWSVARHNPKLNHIGKSWGRTAKALLNKDGIKGFYGGFGGKVLKVAPSMALTFFLQDAIQKQMNKKAEEKTTTHPFARMLYKFVPGKAMYDSAFLGRINDQGKGLLPHEQALAAKIPPSPDLKTYPTARIMTNPITIGVGGAALQAGTMKWNKSFYHFANKFIQTHAEDPRANHIVALFKDLIHEGNPEFKRRFSETIHATGKDYLKKGLKAGAISAGIALAARAVYPRAMEGMAKQEVNDFREHNPSSYIRQKLREDTFTKQADEGIPPQYWDDMAMWGTKILEAQEAKEDKQLKTIAKTKKSKSPVTKSTDAMGKTASVVCSTPAAQVEAEAVQYAQRHIQSSKTALTKGVQEHNNVLSKIAKESKHHAFSRRVLQSTAVGTGLGAAQGATDTFLTHMFAHGARGGSKVLKQLPHAMGKRALEGALVPGLIAGVGYATYKHFQGHTKKAVQEQNYEIAEDPTTTGAAPSASFDTSVPDPKVRNGKKWVYKKADMGTLPLGALDDVVLAGVRMLKPKQPKQQQIQGQPNMNKIAADLKIPMHTITDHAKFLRECASQRIRVKLVGKFFHVKYPKSIKEPISAEDLYSWKNKHKMYDASGWSKKAGLMNKIALSPELYRRAAEHAGASGDATYHTMLKVLTNRKYESPEGNKLLSVLKKRIDKRSSQIVKFNKAQHMNKTERK